MIKYIAKIAYIKGIKIEKKMELSLNITKHYSPTHTCVKGHIIADC